MRLSCRHDHNDVHSRHRRVVSRLSCPGSPGQVHVPMALSPNAAVRCGHPQIGVIAWC